MLSIQVPPQLEGSPRCHRERLEDLLTLVKDFGLPHLLITLTADETSELRWSEIGDLEHILDLMSTTASYTEAPVECAAQFMARFKKLLDEDILNKKNRARGGIFGKVLRYMYRLEVQERGSLHVHMVLWLDPSDVDRVSSEIVACVPAEWDEATGEFIPPTDPEELLMYRLVRRKEIHKCSKVGCPNGCRRKGYCKEGAPWPINMDHTPRFNARTKRYDYYRPGVQHQWVVPYHPALLRLWGAHVNVYKITNESWSRSVPG